MQFHFLCYETGIFPIHLSRITLQILQMNESETYQEYIRYTEIQKIPCIRQASFLCSNYSSYTGYDFRILHSGILYSPWIPNRKSIQVRNKL